MNEALCNVASYLGTTDVYEHQRMKLKHVENESGAHDVV